MEIKEGDIFDGPLYTYQVFTVEMGNVRAAILPLGQEEVPGLAYEVGVFTPDFFRALKWRKNIWDD